MPDFVGLIGSTYSVPLFFLISGFCIHLSQLKQNEKRNSIKLNLLDYFSRRFWRIYPAYLIILLFACTIKAINGEKVGLTDFLIHLFVFQGFSIHYFNSINLVLWTITVEIAFYLLYPLWYFFRNKFGHHIALLISFIITLISWLFIMKSFNSSIAPTRFFILNIWVSWCFGAWLCEELILNSRKLDSNVYWWVIGAFLLLLNYVLGSYWWFQFAYYNIIIALWAWIIVPLFRVEGIIERKQNFLLRLIVTILVLIGVSSYSLYMLHEPLMVLRNVLLLKIVSPKCRIIVGGLWIIVTFIISWISFQLFEKPFLSYRFTSK